MAVFLASLRGLRSAAGCSLALATPAVSLASLRGLRSAAGCSLALATPASRQVG